MNHDGVGSERYRDTSLSFQERALDLVSRMTLAEKIGQMVHDAPAIPRLGVPAHNWWNECLHGVGRAGIATVFPQAIGLAATWDVPLIHAMASAIADEARAKHHEATRQEDRGIYKGLTFWSPNINIFRDPRWGRGQETYGEDPYLTGRLGVAFVKGLQGDDPRYLKLVATPKHFAVHSGPERDRHRFDAQVSVKELRETYLPHFKECIQEGGAWSIMGAYNRVNGEAACASQTLLQDILRDEWGFKGYVVSDCGAICDIHAHHHLVETAPEASALAVRKGCDLNCGDSYAALTVAVDQGLIQEKELDTALQRLFEARMRLGQFDPPDQVPYTKIPFEVNDCQAHRDLALKVAQESLVLLKNQGNLLPLRKDLKSIAIIGPNAESLDVLLGNYNGTPSHPVTALEGIRRKIGASTEVFYAQGCALTGGGKDWIPEAVAKAQKADVAILVLGLSPRIEGEEGDAAESDFGGDRRHLGLPEVQSDLLDAVVKTGTPAVLVLMSGSPVAIPQEHDKVSAILLAWYPGQAGGSAIADVLFGDCNPAGRLPITFVSSLDQLPAFEDYRMAGRTYRFMRESPLYPFGYGLSYSAFVYENLRIDPATIGTDQGLALSVDVTNSGSREGEEVVQVYLTDVEASLEVPLRQLVGFQRISVGPGQRRTVSFSLSPRQMALINQKGEAVLEPGTFEVCVGGSQPDARSVELMGRSPLRALFRVVGEQRVLEY